MKVKKKYKDMNRNNDNRKSFDSFEQLSFQNNNCTIHYWYKAGSGEKYYAQNDTECRSLREYGQSGSSKQTYNGIYQ